MKTFYLFACLLVLPLTNTYAQPQKEYVAEDGTILSSPEGAAYYRTLEPAPDGYGFLYKEYFLNDLLATQARTISKDSLVFDGLVETYYSDGSPQYKVVYEQGTPLTLSQHWDNVNRKVYHYFTDPPECQAWIDDVNKETPALQWKMDTATSEQIDLIVSRLAGEGNIEAAMQSAQISYDIRVHTQASDFQFAKSLNSLGYMMNFIKKMEAAKFYLKQAIDIYERYKDWDRAAIALNTYALSFTALETDSALVYLHKALEYGEKKDVENSSYGLTLNNLGYVYKLRFENNESLKYYEKAEKEAEKTGDKITLGALYSNMGNTYENSGELAKAVEYYEKSKNTYLEIDQKADASGSYLLIANLLVTQFEYEKAFLYLDSALVFAKETSNFDIVASVYSAKAVIYMNTSKYKDSEAFFNKAVELYEQSAQEQALGAVYINMSMLFYNQGNMASALENTQKALTIAQKYQDWNTMAKAYSNQGLTLLAMGNGNEALASFNQAVKATEKAGSYVFLATIYNNIGQTYQSLGDYSKAAQTFEKAIELEKKMGLKNDLATTENNLGLLYQNLEDDYKALLYFSEAEKTWLELGLKRNLGLVFNNIGYVYLHLSDTLKATDYLSKSVKMLEEDGEVSMLSTPLNNLGLIYLYAGKQELAIETFKKAVAIEEKLGLEVTKALLLSNLGYIYQSEIGDNAKAKEYLLQALEIQERLALNVELAATYNSLVRLYMDEKDYEKAMEYVDKGIAIAEEFQKNTADEDSQRGALTRSMESFELGINCALLLADVNKAFVLAEIAKARSLNRLLQERQAGSKDLPKALADEENALKNEIDGIDKQLQTELSNEEKAALIERKKEYLNKFKLFKAKVRTEAPDYANLKYPEPAQAIEVAHVLKKNEALVEYYLGEVTATAVIVLPDDSIIVVSLGDAYEIKENIAKFRADYVAKAQVQPNTREVARAFHSTSYKLYTQLVAPLLKWMTTKPTDLIIVPDGELYYIPFEALVSDSLPNVNYSEYNYLVKKYGVTYSPSATTFYNMRKVQKTGSTDKDDFKYQFLGFADPLFKGNQRLRDFDVNRSGFFVTRGGYSDFLMPLPATAVEVNKIGQLFPANTSNMYLKEQATEDNLKKIDLSQYRYIHFATHGLINTEFPELSSIALTQDDNPDEDGFLYTYEMFDLRFHPDVVTLSACETGLGKVVKAEGMIGFTRSLLYAGANAVVLSLWSVNDNSTALFFIDYYKKIIAGGNNGNRYTPIREAQLKMIQSEYSNPFFWAPFVFVGRQ